MSNFSFEGSIAVVTGGAGGIGRALAARLAVERCRVAVADLSRAGADAAAQAIDGAIGVAGDVGTPDGVRAVVDEVESRLGPIDIYCSNAGIATGPALGDDDAWEAGWRVHVMAHVYAARAVLPGMTERNHGAFVVTASAAGLLLMMQSAPYTVTKHGAVALTEWLAVANKAEGLQFHCLCPQGVRTPMVSSDAASEAEVAASGRILEPADVAEAVVAAIGENRFLVLPHPEVADYEKAKVADRDRWLAGMRRLLARVSG